MFNTNPVVEIRHLVQKKQKCPKNIQRTTYSQDNSCSQIWGNYLEVPETHTDNTPALPSGVYQQSSNYGLWVGSSDHYFCLPNAFTYHSTAGHWNSHSYRFQVPAVPVQNTRCSSFYGSWPQKCLATVTLETCRAAVSVLFGETESAGCAAEPLSFWRPLVYMIDLQCWSDIPIFLSWPPIDMDSMALRIFSVPHWIWPRLCRDIVRKHLLPRDGDKVTICDSLHFHQE